MVEAEKFEHEKICNHKTCFKSEEKIMGLFVIDQEIDNISESYEYKPKSTDVFSTQERLDFHNMMGKILLRQ
jgi:ssRNA-specific RNase YbeY (16S rRNA maturation enzyme)